MTAAVYLVTDTVFGTTVSAVVHRLPSRWFRLVLVRRRRSRRRADIAATNYVRFCDEQDFGFGWIDDDDPIRRTSHALVVDGGVWLIDPVAWPEAEAALARARRATRRDPAPRPPPPRLRRACRRARGAAPRRADAGRAVRVSAVLGTGLWREVALWWPEQRVLVVADALGTVAYFRRRGERIGVHPLLRLTPPRSLRRVYPEHILTGHGEGVHEDAARARTPRSGPRAAVFRPRSGRASAGARGATLSCRAPPATLLDRLDELVGHGRPLLDRRYARSSFRARRFWLRADHALEVRDELDDSSAAGDLSDRTVRHSLRLVRLLAARRRGRGRRRTGSRTRCRCA